MCFLTTALTSSNACGWSGTLKHRRWKIKKKWCQFADCPLCLITGGDVDVGEIEQRESLPETGKSLCRSGCHHSPNHRSATFHHNFCAKLPWSCQQYCTKANKRLGSKHQQFRSHLEYSPQSSFALRCQLKERTRPFQLLICVQFFCQFWLAAGFVTHTQHLPPSRLDCTRLPSDEAPLFVHSKRLR